MGLHKTKNFCTAKEIINKVKRQPIEWQIRFANHISDKGLVSKYINNSYNSNTHTHTKHTIQLKNRKKTQTFCKERCIDRQQTHGKMATSLIREIQIKTTVRYYFTPVKMAIMSKWIKGTLVHSWACKLMQPLQKQY